MLEDCICYTGGGAELFSQEYPLVAILRVPAETPLIQRPPKRKNWTLAIISSGCDLIVTTVELLLYAAQLSLLVSRDLLDLVTKQFQVDQRSASYT